ncbi:hypothetical protein [Stutzerimonas azotifigens]|uniref:hypothetical protein n=1 Tax=Stutzerimonas azotifigens TaxID=291995 RepID=UPI00042781B1|nr:hypothetical protein [Stutzerimonas azotifigens]
MPRVAWSLYAYRLIQPDEQFDLFACRENRLHLALRQLELAGHVDRTLCGNFLPAQPRWLELRKGMLGDRRLCRACHDLLKAQRRGQAAPSGAW